MAAKPSENGIGQFFHINDDTLIHGTTGPASTLSDQTTLYDGVVTKLPGFANEYDPTHTYLDKKGGGALLDKTNK